ncbi:MAG: hypothetical protein IJQ73_06480 [Kiritimatiellae bacterium]|nr:hypothetical protein [Kiritimatiellia bacterium]
MNSPKQILTVCALAAASTAAVASQAEVRLDVGEKASRCDWELLSYETVDGVKGRFAHVVATAEPGREVEIPLAAKGRYRIWIGAVAKRYGGYAMHVRLGREKYPDRMQVDFKVPNVPPENPMIGELEFAVADLDGDTLVVRNVPNSPGGIAWVRLEPVAEEPAPKQHKGAGMIATNDSYWIYPNREEFFSSFRHFAGSPVGKIFFCAVTGENSFPVRTRNGVNMKYDPSTPYSRAVDVAIAKSCEKLAAENPRLLEETVEYVHSLGMEIHAYFRPGAAVDFRRFWMAESNAERSDGDSVLYAPENRCRLWDGTAVGRPSYARREVRDYVLRLCAEFLGYGFDGINFAFTRALPATLFEPAFRERFRAEYGEELADKDDPRVLELRCRITGEFLAEVKKLLGERKLSLTVLGSVERNREFGLDVAALAKAGTVDEFIVDGEDFRFPRKITIDKMDFESFRQATAGTKARFRPQFTMWWNGLSETNFRKAAENGCAPACLWDGAHMPWQDWERIRRIDGDDFSAAERWAADHPDTWRVHRLKTVNGFDVVEYPWWLAF